MKKLMAFVAALALTGTVAFAQITVSGDFVGTAVFSSTTTGDADPVNTGKLERPAGKEPRLRFNINGTKETANGSFGFRTQFHTDSTTNFLEQIGVVDSTAKTYLGIGDHANVWGSVAGVRLVGGWYVEDALRGKVASDSDFNAYIGQVARISKDQIFSRFKNNNNLTGFFAEWKPTFLPGAYLGINLSSIFDGARSENPLYSGTDEKTDWSPFQIGVGYDISKVGLVRAQYIGYQGSKTDDADTTNVWGIIEAAFAYTGVKGLVVDFGVKIPTGDKEKLAAADSPQDSTTDSALPQIALGATYTSGPFAVTGLVDFYIPVDGSARKEADQSSIIEFAVEPTYDVGPVIVGLDIGVGVGKTPDADGKANKGIAFGIGAYAKKVFKGGNVLAGLAFSTKNADNGDASNTFGIPIILTLAF
ncbi:MAG: hypothetical protein LBS97_05590 [Treponema sp.]|jgi:hypothetical protein|nr:hypothetical protein [Treponema sp.]